MQSERNKTTNICDTLFGRLSARGLMPVEIPRIIKDVFNIISDGGNFTMSSVNLALERLGWREQIMDEFSFELIIFFLENEYHYEVKKYTLH